MNSLKHIGLLALPGCYGSSLYGLMDTLQVANAHIRNMQGTDSPVFTWQVIAQSAKSVAGSGGMKLLPERSIYNDLKFDIIYIPSVFYPGASDFSKWLKTQAKIIDWLVSQWEKDTTLAATCTGTFLLAETELLDRREATTTWWLEKQFRKRYPLVRLNVKELVVDEGRLITAGAMTSYLYLATQLIDKYASPEIASLCAKALLIDAGHQAQTPYQSLLEKQLSNDAKVSKAQYWLQTHLDTDVDMKEVAHVLGISQRTLTRKFKSELAMTPLTYLQNIRIGTAKLLLETTNLSLTEIIIKVGYADTSSFARLFLDRQGLTPAAYRRRFRRTL